MAARSDCKGGEIVQFRNCYLLRNHEIIKDDLWVRSGQIIDPEKVFFHEKIHADVIVDCKEKLISPGFIDVQINGGFGVDFSYDIDKIDEAVGLVAKNVLAHGVTSICPTLVSSSPEIYHRVLPHLKRRDGGRDGAQILGAHVEGPFISAEKKGAHELKAVHELTEGMKTVEEVYKRLDCVAIITLAPELKNAITVCKELTSMGIIVSVGHSMASIVEGETAVQNGAAFITHLFNAMLPFHHRDPGLVGLLASDQIPKDKTLYYGIIADGNHTHPSTTRIAYRAYPKGIVLVTDACSAMGLTEGIHHIGQQAIEVKGTKALLQGTDTLAGSVATMVTCIEYFWHTTGCTLVEALEAATLHPAKLMKIEKQKGTLDYGTDADFTIIDPKTLDIESTWIAGEEVYKNSPV